MHPPRSNAEPRLLATFKSRAAFPPFRSLFRRALYAGPVERAPRSRCAHFSPHRHVIVPDAGHAVARHQPQVIADLLLELRPRQ